MPAHVDRDGPDGALRAVGGRRPSRRLPLRPGSRRRHRLARRGLEAAGDREPRRAVARVQHVLPVLEHRARDGDRVSERRQGADPAGAQRGALHEGCVEGDEPLLVEARPRTGVEERVVLEEKERTARCTASSALPPRAGSLCPRGGPRGRDPRRGAPSSASGPRRLRRRATSRGPRAAVGGPGDGRSGRDAVHVKVAEGDAEGGAAVHPPFDLQHGACVSGQVVCEQSMQALPAAPQTAADVKIWHCPVESQHPAQASQAAAASAAPSRMPAPPSPGGKSAASPPPSPVEPEPASSLVAASLPETVESSALPLSSPPPVPPEELPPPPRAAGSGRAVVRREDGVRALALREGQDGAGRDEEVGDSMHGSLRPHPGGGRLFMARRRAAMTRITSSEKNGVSRTM